MLAPVLTGVQAFFAYELQDLVGNNVIADILNKLSFCGVVDNHYLCAVIFSDVKITKIIPVNT